MHQNVEENPLGREFWDFMPIHLHKPFREQTQCVEDVSIQTQKSIEKRVRNLQNTDQLRSTLVNS